MTNNQPAYAGDAPAFIDIREVCRRVSLSKVRIYILMKQGRFPKQRRISDRAVRWVSSEIDAWIAAKIAS